MKLPSMPRKGQPVEDTVREIINFCRATRITGCTGGNARITPNGTTLEFKPGNNTPPAAAAASGPFKLSVRWVADEEVWKWQVSQVKSSVEDGTNGDAIDLGPLGVDWASGAIKFDVETTIASTKYIVLKAAVATDLVTSNWTLAAMDAADAVEVGTDAGPPVTQDEIRLLIGKITQDTVPEPDNFYASQAVFSPQRITHGLLNGLPVKVFECAPISMNNL